MPERTSRGLLTELITIRPGDRVSSCGAVGTVEYVGVVEPYTGLWLGVDWDQSNRGKHDGSYNGHRYFEAREPTSGSFIRPDKVELGRSFLEAVRERYGDVDPTVYGHLIGSKTIEVLGMDDLAKKQGQHTKLFRVVLQNMLINRADASEEIRLVCPNVMELDLSKNLLSSWSEVGKITKVLDKLKLLNLSQNRLRLPESSEDLSGCFENVKTLILNDTGISWDYLLHILPYFPGLNDLCLCGNRISQMADVSSVIRYLRTLDLERNQLADWGEVLKLGTLPRLETLNLNCMALDGIKFPDVQQTAKTAMFPALKTLYITHNKLSEWSSIDELNKLRQLEKLFIHNNPVMSSVDLVTSRQIVIAKMSALQYLDREFIEPQERRGAEIDYLKRFGDLWFNVVSSTPIEQVGADSFPCHPRYFELVQKYGAPEPAETKSVSKNNLLDSLVELSIHFPDELGVAVVVRKIPNRMTVRNLKVMVGKLCKSDPRKLQLSYESSDRPGLLIPLANDYRELLFYDLFNGNRLWVEMAK